MSSNASSPFDEKNGDIILRSAGPQQIQFWVWKNILAIASHFFRDMFSLPQPSTSDGAEIIELKDGIPVVDVSEDSETLDVLLRCCYPIQSPILTNLDHIEKVLAGGRKYDLEVVVQEMRRALLTSLTKEQSIRVYAIACRYKLKEEACQAAKASLRVHIDGVYTPELEHIPAGDYFRLLEYRKNAATAAASTFRISSQAGSSNYLSAFLSVGSENSSPSSMSKYWEEFSRLAEAAVREIPDTRTIYSASFLRTLPQAAGKCSYCSAAADPAVAQTVFAHLEYEIFRRIDAVTLDLRGFS